MHHLRDTRSNDLSERSDVLESRLSQGLQDAVLRPDVVDYTVKKLEADLESRFEAMSGELETLRKRKCTLETEVKRLAEALAIGGTSRVPVAVSAALNERGRTPLHQQPATPRKSGLDPSPGPRHSRIRDLQACPPGSLLYSDVPTAKAEILRHVDRIDLAPMETSGERYFVASGEWNLLGSFPSTKSAGAAGRNRTADNGFADHCLTTWRPGPEACTANR